MSLKPDGTFKVRNVDQYGKFQIEHAEVLKDVKYYFDSGFDLDMSSSNFRIKEKEVLYKGYSYNKATFTFFLVMGKWPYGITSYIDGNWRNVRWSNLFNRHHKEEMEIKLRQLNGEDVRYVEQEKELTLPELKAKKKQIDIDYNKFKAEIDYDADKGRLISKDDPDETIEYYHKKFNTLVLIYRKKIYRLSDLIIFWHHGKFPADRVVHLDGDKTNFKIENLQCEFHNDYKYVRERKFEFNNEYKKIVEQFEAEIERERADPNTSDKQREALRKKLINFSRAQMIKQCQEEMEAKFKALGY